MFDLFSVSSSDINLKAISGKQFYEILQPPITKIDLKITFLIFLSTFSGTNEFIHEHVKCLFKS